MQPESTTQTTPKLPTRSSVWDFFFGQRELSNPDLSTNAVESENSVQDIAENNHAAPEVTLKNITDPTVHLASIPQTKQDPASLVTELPKKDVLSAVPTPLPSSTENPFVQEPVAELKAVEQKNSATLDEKIEKSIDDTAPTATKKRGLFWLLSEVDAAKERSKENVHAAITAPFHKIQRRQSVT